jgi:hypothetical protein
VSGCNILVDSNSNYAFCCEKKMVKYYLDGEKAEGEFSCNELSGKSFIDNSIKNMVCEVEC